MNMDSSCTPGDSGDIPRTAETHPRDAWRALAGTLTLPREIDSRHHAVVDCIIDLGRTITELTWMVDVANDRIDALEDALRAVGGDV